jgi:hypothetical protein
MDDKNTLEVLDNILLEATTSPAYFLESEDNVFTESDFSSISKFYTGMIKNIKDFGVEMIDITNDYSTSKKEDKDKDKNTDDIDKLLEKCVYYKNHKVTRLEVHDYGELIKEFESSIRDIDSLSKNIMNRNYNDVEDVMDAFDDYKHTISDFKDSLKSRKENLTKYLPINIIEKKILASKDKPSDIKDMTDDLFHIISSFGKKSLELKKKNSDDPVIDRQIFVYNQCAHKTYQYMGEWIKFFSTHTDIVFV